MLSLNFDTELAESGEDACSILSARPLEFSCVLMDLHMTGITGFEASQKIREMGYSNPIIILSTGSLDTDLLARKSTAGGEVFLLEKPTSKDDLIRCFHSIKIISTTDSYFLR